MLYDNLVSNYCTSLSKTTLGDISEIVSGKRPLAKNEKRDSDNQIPIVGAATIMGYTPKYLYDEPILVTGRVGTHGVIQRYSEKSWPSDNTLVIKSNFYEYVYQVLKRIDYKSLNRGSTQPLITQNDLKSIEILLPPQKALNEFEYIASNLMQLNNNKNKENARLCSLRNLLLPKLMSGQILMED